jgi:hypothetical protein
VLSINGLGRLISICPALETCTQACEASGGGRVRPGPRPVSRRRNPWLLAVDTLDSQCAGQYHADARAGRRFVFA